MLERNRKGTSALLRGVRTLVTIYLVLSAATVGLIAVLSNLAPSLVSPEAWVRGAIVAVTSVLTFLFARGAVQGRPRALVRLRVILVILVIAFAGVLLFVPLPAWMFAEQAVCGVLVLSAAILVFTERPVRQNAH